MKHDDIVLELTKEKLILLLKKEFGEKGSWSGHHWVARKEIDKWEQSELQNLFQVLSTNFENIGIMKEKFMEADKYIKELSEENSLIIEKTLEFPIIKGEAQYKCTKGFIDLIVHCKSVGSLGFSSYKSTIPKEFVIEIKKEEDFNDFGSILRQIKEYKEYYEGWGVKKWGSKIIPENDDGSQDYRIFCLLSTKIPDKIKELFSEEGILCLELNCLRS